MRTRVKICGVTRTGDAVVAANCGVDAIGLNFWPGTPRRVSVDTARAIADGLPPLVTVVGLFVDPTADDVRTALDGVRLDALQFHGDESPDFCASFGRPYIKAIPARPGVDLLQYARRFESAQAWLFDAFESGGMPGGTGATFDWSRVPTNLARPLVLSGGLTAENVGAAIRALSPWAVDVSSGVEEAGADGRSRKGIKSPSKIAAFIREVRDADG
jgi:phosphoribosylanthranilate isomerase